MESRRTIEWLGLSFSVPDEWEIVKHSTDARRGTLMLVDRRRQRLQVSWSACATKPDEERIFDDFAARDKLSHPECTIGVPLRFQRWRGYRRTVGQTVLTRVGFYDKKSARWIDVAIPWLGQPDEAVESPLLASFSTVELAEGMRRVLAFDLDATAPVGWELTGADVGPSETVLWFGRGAGSLDRAAVRRVAMPETWFDGHLENFLKRQTAPMPGAFSLCKRGAYDACRFDGRERMFQARWLVGRRIRRADVAWECPTDHAVYQVTATYFPRQPVDLDSFRVQCHGAPAQRGTGGSLPDDRATSHRGGAVRSPEIGTRSETHAETANPAVNPDAELSLDVILASAPVRNQAVRWEARGDDAMIVYVPIRRKWYMRPPVTWIMPLSKERAVALDKTGREVWEACTGSARIEDIVDAFAAAHHLRFHQARLSVMEFLRQLTRRGLIVIAGPSQEEKRP